MATHSVGESTARIAVTPQVKAQFTAFSNGLGGNVTHDETLRVLLHLALNGQSARRAGLALRDVLATFRLAKER